MTTHADRVDAAFRAAAYVRELDHLGYFADLPILHRATLLALCQDASVLTEMESEREGGRSDSGRTPAGARSLAAVPRLREVEK